MKTFAVFIFILGFVSSAHSDDRCVDSFSNRRQLEMRRYKDDEKITTPGGMNLRVLRYLDQGARGTVYLARVQGSEHLVVIKLAKQLDEDTLSSFRREPKKIQAQQKSGMPHSGLLEHGHNYMIKDFVQGEIGLDWFNRWLESGENLKDQRLQKLLSNFKMAAGRSVYIGDLNPKNLIWVEQLSNWVIIDSGDGRYDLDPETAFYRFKNNFYRRWTNSSSKSEKLRKYLEVTGNKE